tara:strand:+ start:2612 stop:2944 length:333 start_codon:yes stop_codon:yes gene_type:complete
MFAEIELLLSECEYLFSKIRRLALGLGLDPTPPWFRDEIGSTELRVRRVVALSEGDPSAVYRFLLEVKEALLELEKRLKASSGGEDPDGFHEQQLLPRRGRKRRGRDLLE